MDETFIKMCRCATEIQELWEPKPGDLFYKEYCEKDKEFSREHWPHQEDHEGSFHHVTDSLDFINGKTGRMTHHLIQNCIWYPRQEDLQKIYLEHVKGRYIVPMLAQIVNWADNPQRFHLNINIMTLCFVMEKCYQKQWDTTEERWVEL